MSPSEILHDYVAVNHELAKVHWVVSTYFVVLNSLVLALITVRVQLVLLKVVPQCSSRHLDFATCLAISCI